MLDGPRAPWCRRFMAPPLLPVTRLVVCVGCAEHVKVSEDRCPHCGATMPARAGLLARAAIVGVMLVGCTEAQAVYGVPVTVGDAETGDPAMTEPTTGNTTGEGTTSTDSTGGSGSASSEGETTGAGPTTTGATTTATGSEGSETGTGTGTETGTGGETDTDTGTATAEPEYGVPMTTTGPEPDYGVPGTT